MVVDSGEAAGRLSRFGQCQPSTAMPGLPSAAWTPQLLAIFSIPRGWLAEQLQDPLPGTDTPARLAAVSHAECCQQTADPHRHHLSQSSPRTPHKHHFQPQPTALPLHSSHSTPSCAGHGGEAPSPAMNASLSLAPRSLGARHGRHGKHLRLCFSLRAAGIYAPFNSSPPDLSCLQYLRQSFPRWLSLLHHSHRTPPGFSPTPQSSHKLFLHLSTALQDARCSLSSSRHWPCCRRPCPEETGYELCPDCCRTRR